MTDRNNDVRVRFAPSPTGHLHMGNVRVAIFNWLFARNKGGKYLVRIEDTDVVRSKKEYVDSILDSLKWLDLLPDEPILYQLSRIEEHKQAVQELLDKKLAYPCFCEPKALEEKQQDRMRLGKKLGYDGICRNKSYTQEDLKKPHAIRFRLPDDLKVVEFDDAIRGKIKIEADQLDDFVIMRREGIPTYNFVVVLDDIYMKISHIIRGEDHISNTPKQILIYKALNETIPTFAHLPLILGPSGNRLSKRDAAVNVCEYKEKGFLADAFFNYLVRLGWSHGDQEIFTKDEMIKCFSFDHVGKKGSIFDVKKLEWLNGVYIRNLSFEEFLRAINEIDVSAQQDPSAVAEAMVDKSIERRNTILVRPEERSVSKGLLNGLKEKLIQHWSNEQLKKLFEQYKERAVNLVEMVQDMISLSHAPKVLDLSLIKKWTSEKTPELLKTFAQEIEKLDEFDHDKLVEIAKEICAKFEIKLVAIAQPLRLALTGKIVSPGVFELICILDKKEFIKRVDFLIEQLKTNI